MATQREFQCPLNDPGDTNVRRWTWPADQA